MKRPVKKPPKMQVAPKDRKAPPFQMRTQHIERYYFTGTQDHVGDAIDYCVEHGLNLSTVGPKLLGRSNQAKDERRFILLAGKVK